MSGGRTNRQTRAMGPRVEAAFDKLEESEREALSEPGFTEDQLQAESHLQLRMRCYALQLPIGGAESTCIRRLLEWQGASGTDGDDYGSSDGDETVQQEESDGDLRARIKSLEQRLLTQERAPMVEATDEGGAPVGTWDLQANVVSILPARADEAVLAAHDRTMRLRRYPAPKNYNLQGARFEPYELNKLSLDSKAFEKQLRDIQQRVADATRPLLALLDGYEDPDDPLDPEALPEEAQHVHDSILMMLHAGALAQRYRKEMYLKTIHPAMTTLSRPEAPRPMISAQDMERMDKVRKQQMTLKALRPQHQPQTKGKGRGGGRPWRPRGGGSKGSKGGKGRKGGKGNSYQPASGDSNE